MSKPEIALEDCTVTMTGCSFENCTANGRGMSAKVPVIVGKREHGNIAWPPGWSNERRKAFRMANNLPGCEWKPAQQK